MKCVICKFGELQSGQTNVTHERDTHVVVITDVLADICDSCGEYYLSSEVARAVFDLAERSLASGREYSVLKFAA